MITDQANWDRPVPRQWQWASLLLPLAVVAALAGRMHAAEPPQAINLHTDAADNRFGLPPERRRAIFAEIASHHDEWHAQGMRFSDVWSQHDNYANLVSRHIHYLTAVHGLGHEVLFLIYDEGIRRRWPDPAGRPLPAQWVVLKPRTTED